jgi:cell division septation protein DedD
VLNEFERNPSQPQVEHLLPPPEAPIFTPPPEPALEREAVLADEALNEPGQVPGAADEGRGRQDMEGVAAGEAAVVVEPIPTPGPSEAIAASDPLPAVPPLPQAKDQAKAAKAVQQATLQTPSVKSSDASDVADRFVIQLASFSSMDAVAREWVRLQRSFPDLLGGRSLNTQTADVGNRGTFYRLQTGPFASRSTAEQACAHLKARKQDCLVVQR